MLCESCGESLPGPDVLGRKLREGGNQDGLAPSVSQPLKNQLNRDPCPLDDRFPEHDLGSLFDMLTPVHWDPPRNSTVLLALTDKELAGGMLTHRSREREEIGTQSFPNRSTSL